ncbi:MAG: hypothetical protein KatS3mg005_1886 [Bryobacteraceae bacterium]|nr:MAG: hypothetical protein KatS3mg005_1886 [Bryobacteraceae bacterium]
MERLGRCCMGKSLRLAAIRPVCFFIRSDTAMANVDKISIAGGRSASDLSRTGLIVQRRVDLVCRGK